MCLQMVIFPVAYAQEKSGSNGDEFRSNPEAKGKESSKKQLAAMAIGVFGANSLVCGNGGMFPSNIAFAAGALIYIMSEISGGKKHADYLRKKTEDLKIVEEKLKKQGGGGEVQLEALESALANEKEILGFINGRKKWLNIISLVFAVATAAAAVEFIIPTPMSPLAVIPMVCPGSLPMALATSAAVGAAFAYFSGGGMKGAFGAALVSVVVPLAVGNQALNAFTVGRIAFYAASTMIMKSLASDMSKKAQVAQGNIDKLEKALEEFKKSSIPVNRISTDSRVADSGGASSEATGGTQTGRGTLGNNNGDTSTSGNVNLLPAGTARSTEYCATKANGSIDISQKACNDPIRLTPATFEANLNMPDLMKANQTVVDIGNAFTSGDIQSAEINGAKLAAQAGRINQLRDDLMKSTNNRLIASGQKSMDINATAKDQLAQMSNSLKGTDQGTSAFLADLSKGTVELGDDLKGLADIKGETLDLKAADQNNKVQANVAPTSFTEPSANSPTENATADANKNSQDTIAKGLSEGLEAFESSAGDISDNQDESLFKIVSNRYLLNYPTLVKRKSLPALEENSK